MVEMTEANDFSPCMSGLLKSAGNKTDGKQCIWDKTPSISLIHWTIIAVNIKQIAKMMKWAITLMVAVAATV
jgi:hypothetical protein